MVVCQVQADENKGDSESESDAPESSINDDSIDAIGPSAMMRETISYAQPIKFMKNSDIDTMYEKLFAFLREVLLSDKDDLKYIRNLSDIFLNRLYDQKNVEESKHPQTEERKLLQDEDSEDVSDFSSSENGSGTLPNYFENQKVGSDQFKNRFVGFINICKGANELKSKQFKMINEKFISEFTSRFKKDEQIDLGELDIKIFNVNKGEGVVFIFGYAIPDLFNRTPEEESSIEGEVNDEDEVSDQGVGIGIKAAVKELPLIDPISEKKLIMVSFPKTTRPIKNVACGKMHALALTVMGEMFSWGVSSSGALGIKDVRRIHSPQKITISENGYPQPITQVECGSMHSMCITLYHKTYSWGNGGNGRLGHGDSKNKQIPTLIKDLQEFKILKVS